jgi:hypothetical protein
MPSATMWMMRVGFCATGSAARTTAGAEADAAASKPECVKKRRRFKDMARS